MPRVSDMRLALAARSETVTGAIVLDRVCPHCARFVKHDAEVFVNGLGQLAERPNATCSRCGRVTVPIVDWAEIGGES